MYVFGVLTVTKATKDKNRVHIYVRMYVYMYTNPFKKQFLLALCFFGFFVLTSCSFCCNLCLYKGLRDHACRQHSCWKRVTKGLCFVNLIRFICCFLYSLVMLSKFVYIHVCIHISLRRFYYFILSESYFLCFCFMNLLIL